jgi:flagellin-like protein
MNKGISPFIASVLLISFVVAVAGIYGGWFQSFINTITGTIEKSEEKRITCIYGGIALDDVEWNSSATNISGTIENTDIISLGNVDIEIFYDNASRVKKDLNIILDVGEKETFNVDADSNYDKVRVLTNCSNVDDEVGQSDISSVT